MKRTRSRIKGPLAHLLAARALAGQTVSVGVEVPDGRGIESVLYEVLVIERRVTTAGEALSVVLTEAR